MKTSSSLLAASILGMSLLCATAFTETLKPITLLKPQLEGGKPLMQALQKRSSSRSFSSEKLPRIH